VEQPECSIRHHFHLEATVSQQPMQAIEPGSQLRIDVFR